MSDVLTSAITAAVADKMPTDPGELSKTLALWVDLAHGSDAAKYIIQEDGSVSDECWGLLLFACEYFRFADTFAKSTTTYLLKRARARILRVLADEIKKKEGK